MNIGKLKLKNSVFLAPMSGISDYPYREIVKKFGPGLVFSEMIASRALIEKNRKTLKMIKKDSNYLYAIQIAGCDPKVMGEAAKMCEDFGADIIDINMGCPVKKVVNGYAGSALMKDELLAISIIESVVNSVNTPVTLKMRKGWDEKSLNAVKLAVMAELAGIKLITIHGRTRCQMFKGKSDWKFIKNVKKAVKVPVIVNGDITNILEFKKAQSLSCADGVMIGRGSYGRPWIFKEISENLSTNKNYKFLNSYKKDIILEHFSNSLDHYGEEVGIKSFRKHLGWYSKSLENSNEFRCKINNCLDKYQLKSLIKDFF
ncbi:MAG: tRNA dihydrouridine synthase DusB [Rickettsiales bacterium]|nr:tRNA dihydrouridine synthase DusB [Rickettsiales bacterium]RPG16205.1 MAG: tRNA dihydrouridine synthase DusB [Pelagibacteraceae bacterium TMED195]|tara:strand:+ start:658 stop:1605 length:948 start_codon:yes stop_codon:yes gene_type:complete